MIRKKSKHNKKRLTAISIRVGFFIVVLLALIEVFTFGTKPYVTELNEGDVAVKDIFAPFDFTYYGNVDAVATQRLKTKATENITLVYDFNEEARKAPHDYAKDFFARLEYLEKEKIEDAEEATALNKEFPHFGEASLIAIKKEDREKIKSLINEAINDMGSEAIITTSEEESIKKGKKTKITVRDLKEKKERLVEIDELIVAERIDGYLNKIADKNFKEDNNLRAAVITLLKSAVSPNAKKNTEEFSKRRKDAEDGVQDVLREIDVKKNEIILQKGERVGKFHTLQLEEILSRQTNERSNVGLPLSMSIIILVLLSVTVVSLKRYGLKVYNNNTYLLLVAIISILFLVGVRFITISFLSSYFIPIAGVSMLIAILVAENVAFLITLMLSIGCGIIVGNKLDMMIICLVGGVVGIYAVRGLRKRFQLLNAGLLVGGANFIMISSFGVLANLTPSVFLTEAGKGLASGVISSFIVMGLLPLFEYVFKITTDITLLELSDLNHPLLKELTLKAPGTYHHSLLVGNLAEAACDAIGANPLLSRVGAYYHDIGKVVKPEYFSENAVKTQSQHDKLSPTMSALIITNHVKDGVELARKHKLNQAIVDFIQQHHGNTLIYYFYQRALEKTADEKELKEANFRYPGPRPQTKETAIVLLADAVEASSRTLSNPTPARIEGLVRKIINNKFIDGQLDECELTLKDINKIAQNFVRILTGVFHSRVEYPDAEERARAKDKNKENQKNSDSKRPNSKKNNT